MNAPGKGMLKVVSIIFIIFGAIATILSLIAVFGSALLGGLFIFAAILALIGAVLELVVGIIGLKKCGDPAQAMFFIVSGIILCAINLISMVMYFQVSSLIGFVLPVLFIVGGFMNKNAVAA
jgi:hypothetical protein